MKVEQLYTECLAQGAYYIESEGEVAIIDPLREIQPYIEKARKNHAAIKYVFETHFHADFVSGHIDLAKKTGATIVYGPGAVTDYDVHIATDEEVFSLGAISIKALHTPGHTLESTTYLLMDENGKEQAIFTGDTLFIDDVGRPDLAIKSDLTREDLAGMLYDSLRTRIMPLHDDIIVYPAHGAGSACGKNLSEETSDTLGHQKKTNYALRSDMTKAEFIEEVLDGILPAPQYFAKNAKMNKEGYTAFERVLKKGNIPIEVKEFEALAAHGEALVLDVRDRQDYTEGHIPGAIFIGLDGSFAPWVGTLITDIKQPLLLVVPEGASEEAVTRLSRVGYDNTLGYLEGGMDAWTGAGKETDNLRSISTRQFEKEYGQARHILDVRRHGEYALEHLEKAQHFPLSYINENRDALDREHTYYIYCAGGYRSVITASILKAKGFTRLINVRGGYDHIIKTNIPRTQTVSSVL